MNKALHHTLTVAEQRFVEETSRKALDDLDEEQVLDLLTRARRLRSKYVTSYRRTAALAVEERGGRGLSYAENSRDRGKAEVFEKALARVSTRLSALAAESAAALKKERIAAAKAAKAKPPKLPPPEPASEPASRPRGATKTTGGTKKDASSRAKGKRRQARRDAK